MGPGWVAPWGPRGDPVQRCPQGRRGGQVPFGASPSHPIPEGARIRLSLPAVPSPSACAAVAKQEAAK